MCGSFTNVDKGSFHTIIVERCKHYLHLCCVFLWILLFFNHFNQISGFACPWFQHQQSHMLFSIFRVIPCFNWPIWKLLDKDIIAYFFWKSCIWHNKKIKGQKIAVFIYECDTLWHMDIIDVNISNFNFIFIRIENTFSVIGFLECMTFEHLHCFHLFFNFRICFHIFLFKIFQIQIFPILDSRHCCVKWTIVNSSSIRKIN